MLFRAKTLEGILSTFEKTAEDLAKHILTKGDEAVVWAEKKIEAEIKLAENSAEVSRAARVLSKVKELVS